MHWKYGGFTGQGGAFIGSGNWTSFELYPFSATNFKDETEMYTNDPTIVKALRYKIDLMWADVTDEPEAQVKAPYMLDWPDAYKNDTGKDWLTDCPVRVPGGLCQAQNIPHGRADSGTSPTTALVWGQGSDIITAMINEINAEPVGGAID